MKGEFLVSDAAMLFKMGFGNNERAGHFFGGLAKKGHQRFKQQFFFSPKTKFFQRAAILALSTTNTSSNTTYLVTAWSHHVQLIEVGLY